MKKFLWIGAAISIAFAVACASAPKTIPESLSSSELVQRAQEASDGYNYPAAIAYYTAAIERFGSDPSILSMGEYEIAFIYYKEAKYKESHELFTKLLALYDGPDAASYPPTYATLARKVFPKVEAALKIKK